MENATRKSITESAKFGLNITIYNYNKLNGKCNKNIKHNLKSTYTSAN